jgi:hypothetical protein
MVKHILKNTLELSDNQCNLVIAHILCFFVQTLSILYLNPSKFRFKWFIICFMSVLVYSIAYYKFFSD